MAISKEQQELLTPSLALQQLKDGNKRFVQGTPISVLNSQLRNETVDGQFPIAIIISCIDSRVPVEQIFDQNIGDIFVARVAGNFENPDILGSMEYACAVAGSKLIVVLGHAGCGAVKAACDGVELGHITDLLTSIQPAVDKVQAATQRTPTSQDADFVNATIVENVRLTMGRILEKSSILNDLHSAGTIDVVGGVYQLDTGEVTWLD